MVFTLAPVGLRQTFNGCFSSTLINLGFKGISLCFYDVLPHLLHLSSLKSGVYLLLRPLLVKTGPKHACQFWSTSHPPGSTYPLSHVCRPLAPDAVDGCQDAVAGLHRVEDGALHGSVAGAAHGEGHAVPRLEHVLDAALDVAHDLGDESRRSGFIGRLR